MELQRFARSALSGLARPTAASTASSTLFTRLVAAAQPARHLSATASRLALPPRPPPASSSSPTTSATTTAPWPPKRTPPPPPPAAAAADSSKTTAASNPLAARYASDNPAQWAMWSSDDFYKRHLGDGGSRTTGGSPSGSSGGGSSGSSSTAKGGARVLLKTITGRTMHVGGSMDAARAFLMVDVQCTRNRVRADFHRQRFHERPGLRRKRLRYERDLRRFRTAIKENVARVSELAKQGW